MGTRRFHHRQRPRTGLPGGRSRLRSRRRASQQAERLFEIKYVIQTAIEACIQAKEFTRNNEADVVLTIPAADAALLPLLNDREFATEFFIIAGLSATAGEGLAATARKTDIALCPRCRKHEPLVAKRDVPTL